MTFTEFIKELSPGRNVRAKAEKVLHDLPIVINQALPEPGPLVVYPVWMLKITFMAVGTGNKLLTCEKLVNLQRFPDPYLFLDCIEMLGHTITASTAALKLMQRDFSYEWSQKHIDKLAKTDFDKDYATL